MNASLDKNLLQVFDREQEEIHKEISNWRRWWQELKEFGEPRCGEMSSRLTQIRAMLTGHIQREEREGLFSGEFLPRTSLEQLAERLSAEHAELIAELDDLIERLHGCKGKVLCWGEAGRLFETFLQHLEDHERVESEFLEQRLGRETSGKRLPRKG